jgi:hypothetical protein
MEAKPGHIQQLFLGKGLLADLSKWGMIVA